MMHKSAGFLFRFLKKNMLSRRRLLSGGLLTFLSGLYVPRVFSASPADDKKAPASLPVATLPPKDVQIINFIEISQCLTDRKALNYATAVALYNAIVRADKARVTEFANLHQMMTDKKIKKSSNLARLAERTSPRYKAAIHDILTGWYRGVADGRVITYGSSLMFETSKDAVYPKTYAQGSPFYWKYPPPEVRLPRISPALTPSPLMIEPT